MTSIKSEISLAPQDFVHPDVSMTDHQVSLRDVLMITKDKQIIFHLRTSNYVINTFGGAGVNGTEAGIIFATSSIQDALQLGPKARKLN